MAERKKIDVEIISSMFRIGKADVKMHVFDDESRPLMAVEVTNLKALSLDIDESREIHGSYFAFDLAHRIVYYAVTGHEAPQGEFDYETFSTDSIHLCRMVDTIRTLVEAHEQADLNSGHCVMGSMRHPR